MGCPCFFESGFVSSQLKIAHNYRPISFFKNFSTNFDKIVSNLLANFLNVGKILSPTEFVFKREHSTITSALHKIELSIAIFCDIKKAFDTVDHEIWLKKLENIGIRGT